MIKASDLSLMIKELAGPVRDYQETKHQQTLADVADAIAEQLRPMKARIDKLEQQLSSANKQLAALERKRHEPS